MASWFKVAEDIFEVVDRRAKLVVSELADEQSDSKSPASVGQESQARRTKLKEKARLRRSANEPPKTSDTEREETNVQVSADNGEPDMGKVSLSSENGVDKSTNPKTETSKEPPVDLNEDGTILSTSLPEAGPSDVIKHDSASTSESPATVSNIEDASSSRNGNITIENTSDGREGPSSLISVVKGVDDTNGDHPNDSDRPADADQGQDTKLGVEDVPLKIVPDGPEPVDVETTHSSDDSERKDPDQKEHPFLEPKKQQEQRSDTSPIRVQDQLDEAQGLLKSAVSTGQSKEARLARVCAGLSSRLQEYKSENAQLEELLVAERERSNSYEAHIKQLQQDLTTSKTEVSRVESSMGEALTAKNLEIETLTNSTNALKKQTAASEGKLASLQADMESIMRNRELTETRMMQALREELAAAERRAEEERAAHNATKMSAMEREVELEHRALEASTALARIQRTADERASRAADLEQNLVLLEAECTSLNQELQDMEARARREQKRPPEEANQALQMQAWQEEVERARQGQRDAESKLSSMEAEVQKMRVEMAGMKRDAEHYSRQEHMELEKRYRELTDLLYYKQTQLETMASEKAAAEFQLEKEAKRLQEAQAEAERSRVPRRASSTWEEDTDLKALEPLPLHHRHMAGASVQLQKAAKLLDSGAVSATRFLWRYPVARIVLLFYLVFVHLFLMYLLHRLQEQADTFSANEVAASMGLAIPNLP